jgi:hypothetical protein
MTEQEWLASASPVAMLNHVKAEASDQKVLFYACALCHRRPELLTDDIKSWLAVVEKVVAGEEPAKSLDGVQRAAEYEVSYLTDSYTPPVVRAHYSGILDVVLYTWYNAPVEYEIDIPTELLDPVRRANAELVRDIYGNPFRPITFDPIWRTDTAVVLARQMYESHDFGAMPILADALQDAGCDNEDILAHCRTETTHVRGCWVVNWVLNKS